MITPITLNVNAQEQWDNSWSYYQEIFLPIDTSLSLAIYQPIDITTKFEHPCWALDETTHSIRIICYHDSRFFELESQIYDLDFSDTNHINRCNVVFLIPPEADGTEKYYVYYDDSEKTKVYYEDHLDIEESYYRYEPIPGYPLESYYYKIIDDASIVYTISYDGQFMGYNTCQHIYKMIENSTEVLPKNAELFAAFDFKYCYEDGLFGYSSTSQEVVSKEILVNGNLMVEVGIESTSKLHDLHTIATYKYYHCPSPHSRIHAHVTHESLSDITIYSEAKTDGSYASLQLGGVKSKSIDELNIGEILPYMSFYDEQDTISSYDIDIDPEYIPTDPDIRIISIQDDIDLGVNPWFCFTEGSEGNAHSIIFYSNNVLKSGSQEQDGLQLNAFEMDYPHLPGLENNIATIQVGRNSIEPDQSHDLTIPNNFRIEYDAEFFSTKTKGSSVISEETTLFQQIVPLKPSSAILNQNQTEEKNTHNLSVYVHNSRALPMGATLSALSGLSASYINVELYKKNEFIYSENAVRLPMNALEEVQDPTLFQQLGSLFKVFDYKNISVFKKADFTNIQEGDYVIKIYRENSLLHTNRSYIAYATVNITKDETIHIWCEKEISFPIYCTDQNNKALKGLEIQIINDNHILASEYTNEQGQATILIPTVGKTYDLIVKNNGFIIHTQTINLGLFPKITDTEQHIILPVYSLQVEVSDTWGLPPYTSIHPTLHPEGFGENVLIKPTQEESGIFTFVNITPFQYTLHLSFKSFTIEEEIVISDDTTTSIQFPAIYPVSFNFFNARGSPQEDLTFHISRSSIDQIIEVSTSHTTIDIPPGEYTIRLSTQGKIISQRLISIQGEKTFDVITTEQPDFIFHLLVLVVLSMSAVTLFFLYKKKYQLLIYLLVVSLVLLSFLFPWWQIHGTVNQLETTTQLYLIPNNMITLTSMQDTLTGEASYLPEEFTFATTMILLVALIGCVFLYSTILLKTRLNNLMYFIVRILNLLVLLLPLIIYLIAINEVSSITVGSISGNGFLDIGIPGTNSMYATPCVWSLSSGFYLYALGLGFLSLFFIYKLITRKEII